MKNNTEKSFSDKWENNKSLAIAQTIEPGSVFHNWILERNGFKDESEFRDFLANKPRILDAGCGNGRVTWLMRKLTEGLDNEIMGIDLVADQVAAENLAQYDNVHLKQKDLLGDLSDIGKFQFIYSQEVLHHTDDPQRAFNNLVETCLEDEGVIAIYVYKEKAPIREFTDDYVRDRIKDLSYEDAMKVNSQITEFGKALSQLGVKVTVPDVDILEIKAGEYDVQRLIYHFFMKCFYNSEMSFEDNIVLNYDWYHPQNCERYRLDEIEEWFEQAGLSITHRCVDHYGITVHGTK